MAPVRYRITIVAAISYILFCCAAPAIPWLYLLLLQDIINPNSLSSLIIVDTVGLGLVIYWGRILDRIYVPIDPLSNQGTAPSDKKSGQDVLPAPAKPTGIDTLRKWCEWAGVIFYGILSWIILFALIQLSLWIFVSVAGWSTSHRHFP